MARGLLLVLLVGAFVGVSWCARIPNFRDAAPNKRFWFHHYYQPVKPKPTKFDIVIVLDSSNSVDKYSFFRAKLFAINLLNFFSVFPAKTRFAAVSYNSSVRLEFDFKKHVNKECVRRQITEISYLGGSADTGKALEYVRTDLIFNNETGARHDVEKVIFLFTTGKWDTNGLDPKHPAGKLKQGGVEIFVVRLPGRWRPRHNFGYHNRKRYRFRYWWLSRGLRMIASGKSYILSTQPYEFSKVISLLNLESPKRCYPTGPLLDECGRRCKCVHGKLVQCCRLRKEFLDMTEAERRLYIKTVKTASTHPTYKARYEALLTIHRTIFFSRIHELDFFLPWHRWFILQYENLLREIDCSITIPYWDWSLTGADPLSSDVWNPGPHGMGGDGNGTNNCVDTGPFREEVWSLIQSAGGGCLRRQFQFRTPDAVAVKELIMNNANASDFENFEFLLRRAFHDLVHCVIDGTMCTIDSASAPEFFLHHGFVDKIWWDWQKLSNNHTFNEYFVTQTDIMPATMYRSRDFLNLNDEPGCVCAEYVPSRSKIYTALQKASLQQLKSIKRLPMPHMPKKAIKLFKITKQEMKRLHKLMEPIEPRKPIKTSLLQGKDKALGFKSADILKTGESHTA